MQFDDARQLLTHSTHPLSAFTTFNVKPDNRLLVLYIGSVDPVNNSTLNLAWKNSVFEGAMRLRLGALTVLMGAVVVVMSLA